MTRAAISQSTFVAGGGHHGAGAEHGDAGQHDLLAAEEVAERPAGQHEGGEGQRIAVDDPLQRGDAGMQAALDVGQADADDGVVEERQEEDGAEGGERQGLGGRAEAADLDGQAGRGAVVRHAALRRRARGCGRGRRLGPGPRDFVHALHTLRGRGATIGARRGARDLVVSSPVIMAGSMRQRLRPRLWNPGCWSSCARWSGTATSSRTVR